MKRALLLSLLLPACASAPDVVPAGGQPEISASVVGLTMTAFASPWQGNPDDLGDYLTPVAVEFNNASSQPVRVSYIDLILTDETGHRFAAINPYGNGQQMGLLDEKLEEHPVLYAGRGGFRGGGFRGGGVRVGGGVRIGAPRRVIGGGRIYAPPGFRRGVVYGGGGFRGYAPYPHYRGWYGTGTYYWGNPFYAPLGYSTWVWGWSPSYYPSPSAPGDVVALGLPEGVLQPGGRVSGYVYFQRATDRAGRLKLTWDIHDANTGAPVGQAPILLDVMR